jgi:hypothetical protein
VAPKGGFPGFPGGFPKGFPDLPKGFPGFPPGGLPELPKNFPQGGGNQVMMRTVHTADGGFNTRYQDGKHQITVTGQIDDGKAKVRSIEIREGGTANSYKEVSEVPEALRDTVQSLIRLNESRKTSIKVRPKAD